MIAIYDLRNLGFNAVKIHLCTFCGLSQPKTW